MYRNSSDHNEDVAPLDLSRRMQSIGIEGTPSPYDGTPSMYSSSSVSSNASPAINQPKKSFSFSPYDIETLLSRPCSGRPAHFPPPAHPHLPTPPPAHSNSRKAPKAMLQWCLNNASVVGNRRARKSKPAATAPISEPSSAAGQSSAVVRPPTSSNGQEEDDNDSHPDEGATPSPLVKDAAYYEMRRKNNESAKRSRERRKVKEDKNEDELQRLHNANAELTLLFVMARKELTALQMGSGSMGQYVSVPLPYPDAQNPYAQQHWPPHQQP